MEIDKLIEKLELIAEYLDNCKMGGKQMCCKSADVIRLQKECIVDGYNERWHRIIDDMGDNDAEQSH